MENSKKITYRINNIVDFIPELNKIVSSKNKNEYNMYGTASRCLALLIRHSDTIVSHQSLYEEGWENLGKEVTPNTLYQTISELRNQLKNAGLTHDIIKTHPRKGWSIKDDTLIEKISAQPDQAASQPPKEENLKGSGGGGRVESYRVKLLTYLSRIKLSNI